MTSAQEASKRERIRGNLNGQLVEGFYLGSHFRPKAAVSSNWWSNSKLALDRLRSVFRAARPCRGFKIGYHLVSGKPRQVAHVEAVKI